MNNDLTHGVSILVVSELKTLFENLKRHDGDKFTSIIEEGGGTRGTVEEIFLTFREGVCDAKKIVSRRW